MFFVFLAGLGLVLTGQVTSFFQSDELPYQKTYELVSGDNTIPFHFGGVGTFAYENFILIRYPNQGANVALLADCFCAGDTFLMHVTNVESGNTITVIPQVSSSETDCSNYNEEVAVCLAEGAWSVNFVSFLSKPSNIEIFNVTIEVIAAPYGGGIGYFIYTDSI